MGHGQYTIYMDERHDHFSVVPLPECDSEQRSFFQSLFSMLRSLKTPTPECDPVKEPFSVVEEKYQPLEERHERHASLKQVPYLRQPKKKAFDTVPTSAPPV